MTALAFPAAAFASEDGRARYQAAYQAVLDRWPLPVRSRLLETEIGTTHLLEAGPESAPPLLLLHGAGVSATMWARNVAALASHHRLYALDTLGGLGPSVARSRVRSPAKIED